MTDRHAIRAFIKEEDRRNITQYGERYRPVSWHEFNDLEDEILDMICLGRERYAPERVRWFFKRRVTEKPRKFREVRSHAPLAAPRTSFLPKFRRPAKAKP